MCCRIINKMKIHTIFFSFFAALFLITNPARAQQPSPPENSSNSTSEAAKKLANPNAEVASLEFKFSYTEYDGDLPNASDQNSGSMLFRPIFPFSLGTTDWGAKKTFFFRPAFPVAFDQPRFEVDNNDFGGVSGLGDIQYDIALGFSEKSGFLWAGGLVGTMPTATDSDLGGGQIRVGPELLLAQQLEFDNGGSAFIGFFPGHQWNLGGWKDEQYNSTKVEFFINYLPGGGWDIGTDPAMFYDWVENEWTVPLNLKAGKIIQFGDLPVRIELEGNYYVEQPDAFGPDWTVGINITPIVPNFIDNWIRGN